jgi:hypothetical protein
LAGRKCRLAIVALIMPLQFSTMAIATFLTLLQIFTIGFVVFEALSQISAMAIATFLVALQVFTIGLENFLMPLQISAISLGELKYPL